jgi:hypothetical protein
VAILAIALILVGVALYAAKSSGTLLHARGKRQTKQGLRKKNARKWQSDAFGMLA